MPKYLVLLNLTDQGAKTVKGTLCRDAAETLMRNSGLC
jgi:uncharacterized protein with GYD domain